MNEKLPVSRSEDLSLRSEIENAMMDSALDEFEKQREEKKNNTNHQEQQIRQTGDAQWKKERGEDGANRPKINEESQKSNKAVKRPDAETRPEKEKWDTDFPFVLQ